MNRKLSTLVVAVLVLAGIAVSSPADAASTAETIAYSDPGYVNYAYRAPWTGPDCDVIQAQGFNYVWYPGNYVQQRMSSAAVNPGPERRHCNQLWVRSGAPSHPYWGKCVHIGDPGIWSFGFPWENNTDALVLKYDPTCPLY